MMKFQVRSKQPLRGSASAPYAEQDGDRPVRALRRMHSRTAHSVINKLATVLLARSDEAHSGPAKLAMLSSQKHMGTMLGRRDIPRARQLMLPSERRLIWRSSAVHPTIQPPRRQPLSHTCQHARSSYVKFTCTTYVAKSVIYYCSRSRTPDDMRCVTYMFARLMMSAAFIAAFIMS